MVKYETFNLCYVGSIPIDLNKLKKYKLKNNSDVQITHLFG